VNDDAPGANVATRKYARSLQSYHPQHVTIRLVEDAPKLARGYLMKLIRKAIAALHKDGFHIVEFNVLDNHLHLMVEAASNKRSRSACRDSRCGSRSV
jgi:REP element-mobilizing transposase RayT